MSSDIKYAMRENFFNECINPDINDLFKIKLGEEKKSILYPNLTIVPNSSSLSAMVKIESTEKETYCKSEPQS